MAKYIVKQPQPGSWDIYLNDTPIGRVEEITLPPEKSILTWKQPKQRVMYVATHPPGVPDHQFTNYESAIKHAVDYHASGAYLSSPHPALVINDHMGNVKRVIFDAAKDPRMDKHQQHLLNISKAHAIMHNKHKIYFDIEDK